MKTITVTDEQYAYLVNAVQIALVQAQGNTEACERDAVWFRHRGEERAAETSEKFRELSQDTQTQYAGLLAVVKFAGL
ncbi:hypothetical protein [Micromonospora sp. GCM10011541]|uniref:hypothetical protein n=1 Tax=Micromonospora sp. GCM10011541 TaxID=3317336 RepID=UPI0036142D80